MLAQIQLLTVSLLWLACTIDPSAAIKKANDMTMERPWHEYTLEDSDKTITAKFVPHPESAKGKKEICLALGVEKDSKLKKAYTEMITNNDDKGSQQRHNAFLNELEKAKILCIFRYRDNRTKTTENSSAAIYRRMFSYFDGKRSHRVQCYSHENTYQCRDKNRSIKYEYKITDPDPFFKGGEFNSVTESMLSMEKEERINKYSESRKILRVSSSWLTRKQKAFNPILSREKDEYRYVNRTNEDGSQQKVFSKVIPNEELVSATGARILPACSASKGDNDSITVTGFMQVKECLDELTPWQGFCKFGPEGKRTLNEKQINACKLTGRGIIIRQDNGKLLRVSSCEHQPASQHFYCSGKLDSKDTSYKVYFERYGVDLTGKKPDPNCKKQQTLFTGLGSALNGEWNKTTTDSPSSTFNNGFERWGPTDKLKKKQHCFALDVEPNGALRNKWKSKINSHNADDSKAFLKEVSLAKVLCISKYKYKNDTETKYMYSYYTGGPDGKSHRAHCQKKDGIFICKDEDKIDHTLISAQDLEANFGHRGIADEIVDIEDYDESKKIMRVPGRHLANKQIARFPYVSEEMPEYDYRDLLINNRDQRRYVKVIAAIKSNKDDRNILPMCKADGDDITGFKEINACGTEFGIYWHFCEEKRDKVDVCKLGGRGILIKETDGNILRVVACEHQPAAGHFYCSGRIDNDDGPDGELKVYFERYGVYAEKVKIDTVHRCPNTITIVKTTDGQQDVPIDVKKEEESSPPAPVTTTPTCQADTDIDNCVCTLLNHGGRCLSRCPDGYAQTGTGCMRDETPPVVSPPTPAMPTTSTPDCSNGMRTAECNNCNYPMHQSGGLCCDADKHAVGGSCVAKPSCSNGMRTAGCNSCVPPMHESGGLCCDSDKHNAGGSCVPITPACTEGQVISNCDCAGKTYDGSCYTRCPEGTSDDDNNGICDALPLCGFGESIDGNCSGCAEGLRKVGEDNRCCRDVKGSTYEDGKCITRSCFDPGEGLQCEVNEQT